MQAPSVERIAELLGPYLGVAADLALCESVRVYVELLLKWNVRTNLTAVRDAEQLVQRQVGESVFAARFVPASARTLMDFGSGAGFPGIPIQLVRRDLVVTLAESQGKKAAFLREAVRTLGLQSVVWAKRVEDLPASQLFDAVAMRAVDHSGEMLPVALARVADGRRLLRFVAAEAVGAPEGWVVVEDEVVPLSAGRLQVLRRG